MIYRIYWTLVDKCGSVTPCEKNTVPGYTRRYGLLKSKTKKGKVMKLYDLQQQNILTDDPRSSTPQSPTGPGAALGPGIWPWAGTITFAPE